MDAQSCLGESTKSTMSCFFLIFAYPLKVLVDFFHTESIPRPMHTKVIKVLFLENRVPDVQRIISELEKENYAVEEKIVKTEQDFIRALESFHPDLVICSNDLPGYDGISAIKYVVKKYDNLPVIMVTGYMEEERAVEAMKNGAWDYVLEKHLSRLGPSVNRALQTRDERKLKARALKQLKESEMQYRSLYEHAGTGLFQSTLDGTRFTAFNQTFARILGYPKEQLLNMRPADMWYRPEEREFFTQKIRESNEVSGYKARLKHASGQNIYVLISARYFSQDGWIEGSIIDITQAQRDELLRDIIYSISEAATTKGSLNELLVTINFELNRLIKSKNLLIGIVNNVTGILELPYMRDTQKTVRKFPLELSISRLVIDSGQAMFLKKDQLNRLKNEGTIKPIRKLPEVWLGAPLTVGRNVFGILALQDYENPDAFSEEDLRLLNYVARQASMAIHKKKYEEDNRRLRMGVEQSPISIVFTDPEANIVYVNPFFEKLTGYSLHEVRGKNPRVLKSGQTPGSTYKELWDKVTQGEVWKGEFLNRKKNGELYWESAVISPVYDEHGTLINYIGLKEDITQKKQVEEALQESEERFKTLTEQANDGIIMLDPELRIVFWNKAFEKLVGYSGEELENKPLPDIARYEDHSAITMSAEKKKRFKESGQANSIGKTLQLQLRTRDGIWIDTETSLASLKLHNRWYAVSIIRDITLRKKYENELEEARRKAEESDRLKNTFLTNISHELRTPLNAIIGFSEIIEHSFMNPEVYEHANNIHHSGIQLLRIIEDILNLSLIESGSLSLVNKEFPVSELEKDIMDHFDMSNKKYKKEDVEFVLHFQEELKQKKMISDRHYLNYLTNILIDNAVKFTQKGSIKVSLEMEDENLVIKVKDTGIGIAREKKDVIFDKFRQIEETLTRRYGGTGVGLTIVKNFVDLMGGKISVNSKKGKGSEFIMKIPGLLKEKAILTQKKKSQFQPELLNGVKILVAEDEELNYLLLKGLLSRYGAQLIRAGNGQEAIDLYQQHRDTRLILMDIRMPVMNGLEATEKLKQIRSDLPVIAITAYSMQEDKTRALQAGCDEFLTKPVDKDKLNEAIGKFLSD